MSQASVALFPRARHHGDRPAVVTPRGTFTYSALLTASARVAASLLAGTADLEGARVAYRVTPGFPHVAVQWGIWRAGGVAVPLAVNHPAPELARTIDDADPRILVGDADALAGLEPLAKDRDLRFLEAADAVQASHVALPAVTRDRPALMVYTSGTTGRPKGVVTTHATLDAQVRSLVTAWEWSADDRVLLVLPLHHVHGILNVLTCALWSGAACEMPPGFDAGATWDRLAGGELTLFMAVPTVYRRLIAAWESADAATRDRWSAGARALRLMVSGSAALPVSTLERWRDITGHTLLERYGMTELGMALSNPLHGERRPGHVGQPLPGVEVRVVDEAGAPVPDGTPGELEVRGPTVFREYWRRPDETAAAFRDGWFRTGDMAVLSGGAWRLLGRTSVDIIKSGGYKVSALEIEETLRTHPAVAECAVVGRPDEEWGECVCAGVELAPGGALDLETLRDWARERLAPYKIPRALICVDALPRNAMGKVVKPDVTRLFAS